MATIRLLSDKRAKKDGTLSINLVIRIDKMRFVFSIGISTPWESCFDKVRLLDKTVPQFKVKNIKLANLKNTAEKLILDEENKLRLLSPEKIKAVIGEKVFGNTTSRRTKKFTDYLDEFVALKTLVRSRYKFHVY